MKAKIEPQGIIIAYQNGESLNSIARAFGTYPTTVRRILERNGVELRHDVIEKGSHSILNDGDKLIEWAKAQGRLVSRKELAKVVGKTRLSPGYFQKYPELGQYVASYEQKELYEYIKQLYTWLKENNIAYIPNDRSALDGVPVQAKLLAPYEGFVIVIDIKPSKLSNKRYNDMLHRRLAKAKEKDVTILFLKEGHFADLNCIIELLESLKHVKER